MTNVDIDSGTVDGITSLTVANNVDIGNFKLTSKALEASDLTAGRVTFAGANGLLSDDSDMTFAGDTLTVTKLGAFQAAGAINFDNQDMINVDIDSGDMVLTVLNIAGAVNLTSLQDADKIAIYDNSATANKRIDLPVLRDYIALGAKKEVIQVNGAIGANSAVALGSVGNFWNGNGSGGTTYAASNATAREVYVNGQLQAEGQNAAANMDFYPGGTASQLFFEYALVQGDVITVVSRTQFASS